MRDQGMRLSSSASRSSVSGLERRELEHLDGGLPRQHVVRDAGAAEDGDHQDEQAHRAAVVEHRRAESRG